MKKFLKWVAFAVIFLVLVLGSIITYITLALPNVGKPEDITIAITPQRLARGAYLANHVSLCMDCHSQRDWSKPTGPVAADRLGSGGDVFNSNDDIPGVLYVPNITPFNLKSWTDGEIFRTITTGERKNGTAIFPLMPWQYYSKMSREDLYSIIAYIRSLKAIPTAAYPASHLDFPVNILVHLAPQKATLGTIPSKTDTVKYGEYVINQTACGACHSLRDKGSLVDGMAFAGGNPFTIKGKKYYSANITPDKNTGIGAWTQQMFVQRFKSFTDSARKANPTATMPASPMPWYDYSGMNESDLKAIYAYLRTVKAVEHRIIN